MSGFINPDIPSSYKYHSMGRILYDAILESDSRQNVDIGILFGYSTICMAMAAKQTGGRVVAYDLFEDYPYNHSNRTVLQDNLKKYGVYDFVDIHKLSFDDWLDLGDDFDILHVDISNTGNTVEKLYTHYRDRLGSACRVFFEGGSVGRDGKNQLGDLGSNGAEWMIKYNKKKFSEISIPFTVLVEGSYYDETKNITYYPSISELLGD